MRVPVRRPPSLLQVDFRLPGGVDYTAFLRAKRVVTHDERKVEKACVSAVFDVRFHDRHDPLKESPGDSGGIGAGAWPPPLT